MNFSDFFSNTAHGPRSYMRDSLLVVATLGAVILAITIWANYYRKPAPKRKRRERRHHHAEGATAEAAGFSGDQELKPAESGKPRRKRKRRREHRPRNPTLAETGGLPPVRPDDASPRGT